MSNRHSILPSIMLLLAAFSIGLVTSRASTSQHAEVDSSPGRYQIWPVDGRVVMIDTATGRTWVHYFSDKSVWEGWGTPPNR